MRGSVDRRSHRARAGVAALNLLIPGLGLLRVGDARRGSLFLLAPFALAALVTFGLGHLPVTGYAAAVSVLVLLAALVAILYVAPTVLTWRDGEFRAPLRPWSRWYGLAAVAALVLGLDQLVPPLSHRFYKTFYAPSASMEPTIARNDRFMVDMRRRGPPRRGELVVFRAVDSVRVSRVAAVAGDRIAMRAGVPVVNGAAAAQRVRGTVAPAERDGPGPATLLAERLPDDGATHLVLDAGPSPYDDAPEVTVPPGRFFVLGDNRDRSADSRVPPGPMGGAGFVPVPAIVGRPLYVYWSDDRARIGRRLDR